MKTTVTDIQKKLESMLDDLFYDLQTAEGITSGDIYPEDACDLDDLTEQMAKLIYRVLIYEPRGTAAEQIAHGMVNDACRLTTTGSYPFYDGELIEYFDRYPKTNELRALVPIIKADPRVSDVTVYGGDDHFIEIEVWPDCVGVDYNEQ